MRRGRAAGSMRAVLLTALLAVASRPGAQAVQLGRLDPKQVSALLWLPPAGCVGPGMPGAFRGVTRPWGAHGPRGWGAGAPRLDAGPSPAAARPAAGVLVCPRRGLQ